MELFAAVADMLGEGLPLSYLFIVIEANAAPHTKQNALIEWMKAIRSLGIDPQFTLSDKDQSEINALREVWPDAKYQLCLWHILRALKRRLSQNENPGSYNALEAHDKFPVIDPTFVPLGQMSTGDRVNNGELLSHDIILIRIVQGSISPPPEKPLFRIRLCVNGRPAVITPSLKLTLRIPRIASSMIPAAGNGASATNGNGSGEDNKFDVLIEEDYNDASDCEDGLGRCAQKQAAGTLKEYEDDGQRLPGDGGYRPEDDEDMLTPMEIDIIRDVEQLALQPDEAASEDEGESEDDEEDNIGSGYSGEGDDFDGDFIPALKPKGKKVPTALAFKATGGKKRVQKVKKDLNYTFCPLSHRLSILRLISKHFCQHPMLWERHGQSCTRQQIHRDAVLESYYHCKVNNLREVWAYLWTNWYAPGKWELWARSSHNSAIPRKRTTMLVEALWRNFKRMVLHQYNRPRMDFATYALITQGIAPYRVRFN